MDNADNIDEFEADEQPESEQPGRRSVGKRRWITPRLCSALDKAKVKRMRLKK